MRVLITGGNGFVGRHLAKHLIQNGDDVAVSYLRSAVEASRNDPLTQKIDAKIPVPHTAQNMALDITDRAQVLQFVSLLKPDVIYHLAAISSVPQAEEDLTEVVRVNTQGTLNLLDAVREHSKDTRFIFVSSAEVYGIPRPGSLPLTESAELRPISGYGVSKSWADLATSYYARRHGLHVMCMRSFPHVGPGQSDIFAVSSFAKQIATIKLGKAEPVVKVGNLEVKRDYSDVSDIVRGYREAVFNGKDGETYNLCSGSSVGIGEILQSLITMAEVNVEIVEDPARVRPVDIPDIYGSYQKANKDFGWKPRVEKEAMLDSLLSFWLDVLSG